MSKPSLQFHKIWVEQCTAAEGILEGYGLQDAMDYLIGEKLLNFVQASEHDSEFVSELPAFVAEIRRIFSNQQIGEYLGHLEHDRFLAPPEPDLEFDEDDEEPLFPENPVRGAQELFRFARVRSLLQD